MDPGPLPARRPRHQCGVTADLGGLAPAVVVIAEHDPLRDADLVVRLRYVASGGDGLGRSLRVTFPSQDQEWTLPVGAAWHNDFVPLRPDPGERAVQLFTILRNLSTRGGGTLVLTGSHHLVTRYTTDSGNAPHPGRVRQVLGEQLWLRDLWEPPASTTPEQRIHRYMANDTRIGDTDMRVVELTGRPGDAFVMHCDTLHAAAPNCHDEPRMMATITLTTSP